MCSDARRDGLWPSTRNHGCDQVCKIHWTARGHPSLFSLFSLLQSRHGFRQLALVQKVFTVAQSCLFRIAADVAHAIGKVIRIADQSIETNGHKVSRAFLLPMRQAVECLLNLRVRIEKFHARKVGFWSSKIQCFLS